MINNVTNGQDNNNSGEISHQEKLVFTSLYSAVIVLGIIGNSLSIAAFHKTKSLRNTTNYLLGNIAVADLLTVISLIPFTCIKLLQHPKGIAGQIACTLVTKNNLTSVSINVSIFTLGLLAVERYNALVRPMRSALRLTKTTVWYAIIFSWISSLLFSLPLLIYTKLEHETGRCKFIFNTEAYWIVAGILLFVVFTTICYCYVRIIRGFYFGQIIGASCVRNQGNDHRDKRKVVKMLLTVTVVFTLCYSPRFAFFLIPPHLMKSINAYLFRRISFLLVVSNSCINPIIYALQSANFRSSVRHVVIRCGRKTQNFSFAMLSRASRIAPVVPPDEALPNN